MSEKENKMEYDLFCKIGDTVEIIKTVKSTPWPDEGDPETIEKGLKYKVANLIGYGWDLELIEGNGPKFVRILNSKMPSLVKIIEKKT